MNLYTDVIKYGLSFGGIVLDGCPAEFLTFDNINDISTILAYRYEDGKWWHDQTCVMEIIFYNHHDNLENNRVRILYDDPSNLFNKLTQIASNGTSCMQSIKIDLGGYSVDPEQDDEYVNKENFVKFDCKIQHKKHVHPNNPEMPDD